jgi:hypothetical protein
MGVAPGPRGSLCVLGLEGEVCGGLRGGVDQGDEPGPLRPRLISAERTSRAFRAQPQLIEATQVLRRPSTEAEALDKKSGRRFKQVQTPPWSQTPHNPLAPASSPGGFISLKIVQRSNGSHATSNRVCHATTRILKISDQRLARKTRGRSPETEKKAGQRLAVAQSRYLRLPRQSEQRHC